MSQAVVALDLQRVADRVTQVQRTALAGLERVAFAHVELEPRASLDHRVPRRLIVAQRRRPAILDEPPQGRITDERRLHRFGHPIVTQRRREAAQRGDIGVHRDGGPEGADGVLRGRQVDPDLATDGAVGLRQPGRRNVHERQAAGEQRGGRPSDITERPAADRDQGLAALDALLGKPLEHAPDRRKALRSLAGSDRQAGPRPKAADELGSGVEQALVDDRDAGE